MKHYLKYLYNFFSFIIKPFNENLPLFLTIWFCSVSALCIYYLKAEGIRYSIYMLILGVYMCYLVALFASIFKNKTAGKIATITVILFSIINLGVDIIVIETTGHDFNNDIVAMCLGTNSNEAKDFFKAYTTPRMLWQLILFIACVPLVYYLSGALSKKINKLFSTLVFVIFIIVLLFTNIAKTESWGCIYWGKLIAISSYEKAPNLDIYRSKPSIIRTDGYPIPHNTVIIIGESFCKSHSSLYGYDLQTNPNLEAMVDEGNLFIFNNITSPATTTIPAFQSLMSLFDINTINDKKWYEYPTIFDVLKKIDVHSNWISNQSRVGTFDNVVTSFAELADYSKWVGLSGGGMTKSDFDELVIPFVDTIKTSGSSCSFVHLIGQHEAFVSRYPNNYSIFTENDYKSKPNNQRLTLSQYDNSILYNDYVVSEIINKYKDDDAVILYFSDHALDIFESDPTFVGHARANPESIQAGKKIPFMIYISDSYKNANPTFVNKVKESLNHNWNTTNLTYTIADIYGISSINESSVNDYSLFED